MLSAGLAALALLAQPAPTVELLKNGAFQNGSDNWSASALHELKSGAGSGPSKYIVVSVANPTPSTPWSTVLSQAILEDVSQGAELVLSFRGRSETSNRMAAMVEDSAEPYTKHLYQDFRLTPEWRDYRVVGKTAQVLPGSGYRVTFHLGFDKGDIQLANISLAAPKSAVPPAPTISEPIQILRDGAFQQPFGEVWTAGDSASLNAVIAPDSRFGRKLSVTIPPGVNAPNPWSIQLGQVIGPASRAGDSMYLEVWLRSPQGADAWVVHELNGPPHSKSLMRKLDVVPEWREFRATFSPGMAFGTNRSVFKLFFGGSTGTIEIANPRITNFGQGGFPTTVKPNLFDYDPKADSAWRAEALKRIERIRKGDIKVTVLDAARKPVPNATISIEMLRHHFRFGTAVSPTMVNLQNRDGEQFRKHLKEAFNTVVFENELKWPSVESWATFSETEKARNWLKDNGFLIRGHTLVWGSYGNLPPDLKDLSNDQVKERIRNRITDMATRTKDWVYVWDVVNEAVTEVELWDRLGWPEFANTFRLARQAMPGVRLAYNDFNITNENPAGVRHRGMAIARARQIIDSGAPLDIFGDQAHQSAPGTPMSRVLAGWDEVARTVQRPIEITEFDFTSTEDKSHGEYTADYLTAAFSHPRIEAFLMWGFWQGAHWLSAQGGYSVRRDWSPRPAWTAYMDLVKNKWWTTARGKSSGRGEFNTRGFYGQYKITVTAPARRGPAARNLPGGVQVKPATGEDGKPLPAQERRAEATVEHVPGRPGTFIVVLPG